jgi:hypothetical protein
MKKSQASRKGARVRSIKPATYKIEGTDTKVRITKGQWAILSRAVASNTKKVPTKQVRPGIFELEYTPSPYILESVGNVE